MPQDVHSMHIGVNLKCAPHGVDWQGELVHNVHTMHTNRKPHYLREWREYRNYTLERAAAALEEVSQRAEFLVPDRKRPVGTTHQNLGKIERGTVPYSQTLLEMLAEVYGTDPGSLIMRDPTRPEAIFSIWENLSPAKQAEAISFLSFLAERRDGTNG